MGQDDAVTFRDLSKIRSVCPGSNTLPLKVLVTLFITLFALVLGSHIHLTAQISTLQVGEAESRMRIEGQTRLEMRMDSMSSELRQLRAQVAVLDDRLSRVYDTEGE